MRVNVKDGDTEITIEPYVTGPKVILYDHLKRPLKRPIGFTAPVRHLDNRRRPVVSSKIPKCQKQNR